ncbi:MAG: hypothetical protein LBV72_03255 [Tannerella sp.]|jgi:tetratricopeptide (TPR) repeat protein|nr:hypothetical protein [Tannerella sp.]
MLTRGNFITIYIIIAFISIFVLGSCNAKQDNHYKSLLKQAKLALAEKPDNTLLLLQSINNPEELTAKDYANYLLLQVQAHEKAGISIKDDTLMHIPVSFYIQENDSTEAAKANLYAGRVCIAQNKNETAMNYLLKAKDFAEDISSDYLSGQIYYSIGTVYQTNQNYKKALDNFKIAKDYFFRSGNEINEILMLDFIGTMFVEECERDSALYYYQQVLDYAYKTSNDRYIARMNRKISCVYLELEQYDKARHCAEVSISKDDQNNESFWNYWVMANCLLQKGKHDEAFGYVEKISTEHPEAKLHYHSLMSQIHEKNGDYHSALQEARQTTQLQDTIYKDAINNSIPYLQELHEKEKIENSYNKILIQRLRLILTVIVVLLIVVFVGWFLIYRIKRKENELLKAKQTLSTFREMLTQQEKQLQTVNLLLSEQTEQMQNYHQVISERNERSEQLRKFLMNKLDIARKVVQMNIITNENTNEFMRQFHKIFGQNMMDWNSIYPVINDLYNGFVDKIKSAHLNLTEKELQLCCFIRAGFRSDEQAVLLNYTQSSIRVKRTQLVKKMGFSNADGFLEYLIKV